MLTIMFVAEGLRLSQLGRKEEAMTSLKNAWSCRNISPAHKLELRAIINQLAIEIHRRKTNV